jgi:hypothetical protein
MESFVGNDPRTLWNMGTHLLKPKVIKHNVVRVNGGELGLEAGPVARVVEGFLRQVWINQDGVDAVRGKHSWFWSLVGMFIMTGWLVLPFGIRRDGAVFVDYWNPAQVFPEWSSDSREGLVRLGRTRRVSRYAAQMILNTAGIAEQAKGGAVHGQLWKKDDVGVIWRAEVLDSRVILDWTPLVGFKHIPVVVIQAGGIVGLEAGSQGETLNGQSILETNRKLFYSYNRQQTFMMQLLRDTAVPKFWEKISGNKSIIGNPENLNKRGAVFTMGLNDDMGALSVPGIPIELTQMLFHIRNMMQRGGFSDLTYGNVLQEVSAVLIAQAAEGAMQLLAPYHSGMQVGLSMVSNHWYQSMLEFPESRPITWAGLDLEVLEGTKIESRYTVQIPGDLQNRVLIAKMLSPRMELPVETVLGLLLPEVSDPLAAVTDTDSQKVKELPEYVLILAVNSFKSLAQEAMAVGDRALATMYLQVASKYEGQLTQQPNMEDRFGRVSGLRGMQGQEMAGSTGSTGPAGPGVNRNGSAQPQQAQQEGN